jgi:hypothetical protein
MKKLAEFLPSEIGDVLAGLATTSRAMDKWMLQLDSAGQKGPETALEGVLIVVRSCCTTDRKMCTISPLHIPIPCSLLGTIYTFLAIWQCVHRCFGRCFHSTHTGPLAVRPFLSALSLVVGRGV